MSKNIEVNFLQDYANILKQDLISRGYSIDINESNENICLRYFNLHHRSISQKPRTILKSKEFSCPTELQQKLINIEGKITNGDNLLPHLSKNLSDLKYNDPLLNDWKIYHLHLGDVIESDGYVSRTGPLLFARFDESNAYLINIFAHGFWSNQILIRIVHNNWPETIKHFKLSSVIELAAPVTDNIIGNLRKAHLNTLVDIDGSIYAPIGGGVQANGISTLVFRDFLHMKKQLKDCEKLLKSDPKHIFKKAEEQGVKLNNPAKFFLNIQNDIIYAVDSNNQIAFSLANLH